MSRRARERPADRTAQVGCTGLARRQTPASRLWEGVAILGEPVEGWEDTEGERQAQDKEEVYRGRSAGEWVARCSIRLLFPSLRPSPPSVSVNIISLHQCHLSPSPSILRITVLSLAQLSFSINTISQSRLLPTATIFSLSLSPFLFAASTSSLPHLTPLLLPLSIIVLLLQHCLLPALQFMTLHAHLWSSAMVFQNGSRINFLLFPLR